MQPNTEHLHEKDVYRVKDGAIHPEFIGTVHMPARCWQDYPETLQIGDALYRRDDSS